ncbi:MAG TPA: hypothetical protein VFK06_14955 [Candidatus Angelobacter sp.]|nr:hypothetical protein [Candidatus Angelobacter sp.]
MFTGTTIDELMASVERAEQHARQRRQEFLPLDLSRETTLRMELHELVGVA